MKKLRIIVAVTALGLLSAACTADQAAQTTATITTIQSEAKTICSFLPDAAAVAGLVASFVPQAGVAVPIGTQIATAICNAVTHAGAARFSAAAPALVQDAIGQRFAVTGHFVAGGHRRH